MTPTALNQDRPGKRFPGLVFLAAARPHLLIPAWLAALTGGALVPEGTGLFPLAAVAAWSLLLLAVNLANALADASSDLINGKNLCWQKVWRPGHLAAGAGTMTLAGMGLAAWSAPETLPLLCAGLALGLGYSLPPARLCARPGWDLLAHLLGYAVIAPWLGAQLAGQTGPPIAALIYLGPVVGLVFLLTALLDIPGDLATGKVTSAVWLARRRPGLGARVNRPRARFMLVAGVFLGVLLAGAPGLRQWPVLIPPVLMWLGLSYCLQGLAADRG